MPTYEFLCPKGHKFSHFYKTMSTALSQLPCPVCSAVADRQLSASAGFAFKGSGFYLTDYGKNAHRGEKVPATASESSGSSTGGDKRADSAPGPVAPTKSEGKSESSTKAAGTESPKPKSDVRKPSSE